MIEFLIHNPHQINKVRPRIHSIICALINAGTDLDLVEFWLRYVDDLAQSDLDGANYTILGFQLSWSRIIKVSGFHHEADGTTVGLLLTSSFHLYNTHSQQWFSSSTDM